MRGVMAPPARFRHHAAQFAPIFIFLGSFERSKCPLSNEPKILQIGQEMAKLWAKTCEILTDLVNIYRLPSYTVYFKEDFNLLRWAQSWGAVFHQVL
eukprot:sb/3479024/